MRRLPQDHFILVPSFIMDLGEVSLSLLWARLREEDSSFPEMKQGASNADLLHAFMGALPSPRIEEIMFYLSLATARLRGDCRLAAGERCEADHIVNRLREDGEVAVDALCIATRKLGPTDRIYEYDLANSRLPLSPCGFPPADEPREERHSFFSDYFCCTGYSFEWDGWAMYVYRREDRWVTEFFYPAPQCYLIYSPALTPIEADRYLLRYYEASCRREAESEYERNYQKLTEYLEKRELTGIGDEKLGKILRKGTSDEDCEAYGCFCHIRDHEAYLDSLRKEVEDLTQANLSPLMFPIDADSFGEDDFPKQFDYGNLADMIVVRKGLTMPRCEWRSIIHSFDSSLLTGTGVIADRVLDPEHTGEWCRVSPRGTVFCNTFRSAPAQRFEFENDAEMVSFPGKEFAWGTFKWLVGLGDKDKLHESLGCFWIGQSKPNIILSLATSEAELLQQAVSFMDSHRVNGKVVFITAFLDRLPSSKGVIALRELAWPGSYREGLLDMQGRIRKAKDKEKWLKGVIRVAKLGKKKMVALEDSDLRAVVKWYSRVASEGHEQLVEYIYAHKKKIIDCAEEELKKDSDIRLLNKLNAASISLSALASGLTIPQAPDGYGWKELSIELSSDTSGAFVQFHSWFNERDRGRRIAPSKKVKLQLLDGFSVKGRPQEYSAAGQYLIRLALQEEEIRKISGAIADGKGRATRKVHESRALSDTDRDARRKMKQTLAETLGLPLEEDIFNEGRPVFSLRYKKQQTGGVRAVNNSDAQDRHDRELETNATTDFNYNEVDQRNGWTDE